VAPSKLSGLRPHWRASSGSSITAQTSVAQLFVESIFLSSLLHSHLHCSTIHWSSELFFCSSGSVLQCRSRSLWEPSQVRPMFALRRACAVAPRWHRYVPVAARGMAARRRRLRTRAYTCCGTFPAQCYPRAAASAMHVRLMVRSTVYRGVGQCNLWMMTKSWNWTVKVEKSQFYAIELSQSSLFNLQLQNWITEVIQLSAPDKFGQ